MGFVVVWGLGFGVKRVQCIGFKIWDFRVWGSRFCGFEFELSLGFKSPKAQGLVDDCCMFFGGS